MISSRTVPERTRLLEGIDGELFGPHALQGSQPAQEDMVDPLVGSRFLHGQQVSRLFHHADDSLIAPGVAADRTDRLVGLGEMVADLAMLDLVLGCPDRLGQLEGLLRACT